MTASRDAIPARPRVRVRRRKKSRGPEREFFSVKHPAWAALEWEYVAGHAHAGLPRRHPDAIGPARRGDTAGEQELVDYVARLEDPARRDEAIFELLDKVGPDVLRPPAPEGPVRVVMKTDPEAGRSRPLGIIEGASNRIEQVRERIRGMAWARLNEAYVTARAAVPVKEQGWPATAGESGARSTCWRCGNSTGVISSGCSVRSPSYGRSAMEADGGPSANARKSSSCSTRVGCRWRSSGTTCSSRTT